MSPLLKMVSHHGCEKSARNASSIQTPAKSSASIEACSQRVSSATSSSQNATACRCSASTKCSTK